MGQRLTADVDVALLVWLEPGRILVGLLRDAGVHYGGRIRAQTAGYIDKTHLRRGLWDNRSDGADGRSSGEACDIRSCRAADRQILVLIINKKATSRGRTNAWRVAWRGKMAWRAGCYVLEAVAKPADTWQVW